MSNLNKIIVGIRESKLSRAQTDILLKEAKYCGFEKENVSLLIFKQ